jgi:DNA-binding PadR family transcriptional regulator
MTKKPLNATAASLLGFLHDGPMTGWELMVTAEQKIGSFWSLTRSQVYRELAALAEAGLIAAEEPGPRDRRPYSLTDAGRAAFQEWARTEPGPEQIRHPLLLTIRLGEYLPEELLASFVESHRARHSERLAGYEAVRAAVGDAADLYALATLDFGIRYERGVLDWFDHLPPELRGKRT